MEPEARKRLEKIDIKLLEHDEKLIAHDKSLRGIRVLLRTGMQLLVKMEERTAERDAGTNAKINALIDSQTRFYDGLHQLAEAQVRTEQSFTRLEKAQRRTEESLRRFLDRSGNGDRGGDRKPS